jgi:leucyl/phenylalanyl-tRNA--protein transferase
MSSRKMTPVDDPLWSLTWYMRGYYPLYDLLSRFYWERLPERAFLTIDADLAKRAAAMQRRSEKKFRLVKNKNFDACIRHLQNPRVKEFSWVRTEVVRIYQALRARGLLLTLEAINARGNLAGGLVGIILPGVFIAETMFTLEPDASKVCLCSLIQELHHHGFSILDVQTRHDRDPWGHDLLADANRSPHPCVRLGEKVLDIVQFMPVFSQALAAGGFSQPQPWLDAATTAAECEREFPSGNYGAAKHLAALAAKNRDLHHALQWMAINLSDSFRSALAQES